MQDSKDVFVDGRCLEECPVGTVLSQSENTCIFAPNPSESNSTTSPNNGNSTNDFFEEDLWEKQNGECLAEGCSKCGLSSSFCSICKDELIMMDGACLSECPQSTFKVENACFKCNPVCMSCLDSANQCTSCHGSIASLFGQDKLLAHEQMCVSECVPGTFWDEKLN